MIELINDLYAYNTWANGRVFQLCNGLSDEQLDQPREMGFGTLRATLFHILTAEVIWMERWQSTPWRSFPTDPQGMSLSQMQQEFAEVNLRRSGLIEGHQSSSFTEQIAYQDSGKNPYEHAMLDMLLHVAGHGVHHRAQALNYLKHFDRTVIAGIDYIFYRLANHALQQSPEAMEGLTAYGLQVGDPTSTSCPWHLGIAQRLYKYHDWAIAKVLGFVESSSDEALDREFNMGPGSIRKTLLHLLDAERWWVKSWTVGPIDFPQSAPITSIAEMAAQWRLLSDTRNQFIESVNDQTSQGIVKVLAGGPPTRFRIGESIVHLAVHGIHHRAQLINMCRHVDAPWTDIDLLDGAPEFAI